MKLSGKREHGTYTYSTKGDVSPALQAESVLSRCMEVGIQLDQCGGRHNLGSGERLRAGFARAWMEVCISAIISLWAP